MRKRSNYIILAALVSVAFNLSSCQSEDDFLDFSGESTPANIHVKSSEGEQVVGFDLSQSYIIREAYDDGEYDGLSWLSAYSGGIKVNNSFWFSLYFSKIDKIKEGATIKPKRCNFGFIYSSDSRNYTDEYDGKIVLKERGSDYAVIYFDHVVFHIGYGDCTFNGDLKLPLLDQYPWDQE